METTQAEQVIGRLRAMLANAVDMLGDVPEVAPMRAVLQEATDYSNEGITLVELAADATALVINGDGSNEAYFPGGDEDEEAPFNTAAVTYLMHILNDEAFPAAVESFFDAMPDDE